MNPAGPRAIVPPRPNLGPEPWSEGQSFSPLAVGAAILAIVFVVWLVSRQLRRRLIVAGARDVSQQSPLDATPRGRLVAHSDSIREILARQFGPAWRAKTIEELSVEPRLEEVLGLEPLRELIRFLDRADQLKFAPERSSHHREWLEHELFTWEPWLADLRLRIQSEPARPARAENANAVVPGSRLETQRPEVPR